MVKKSDLILEARNISKTFPGVKALTNVNLAVNRGEVHAIVGENGAGKSTLMKILGGVYSPDIGKIYINDKKVSLKSVQAANNEGISVIFQELNLMADLTVAENIFISNLFRLKFSPFLHISRLNNKAKELLHDLHIEIPPNSIVENLTVSQRQLVEIAKAISHNASIIIMDEPTAALDDDEVNKLYEIIRHLKDQGKTILYISHRLKEIFEIADRVSILRDGKNVGTYNINEIDQEKVVRLMVGRDIDINKQYVQSSAGETILRVDNLTKGKVFQNITFDVRAGEVLGIAGLIGCGDIELIKAVYGLIKYYSGTIYLNDHKITIKNSYEAQKKGIALVTEDRKESGIFQKMKIKENTTINILRRLSHLWGNFIDFRKESEVFENYVKDLDIKYASDTQIALNLSGGNRQKLILARALMSDCKVLMLLEPTRGIDVGAKFQIHNLIRDLAKRGIGILLVSSDLPELISLSNRVLVMWQGKKTGLLQKKDITEEAIMLCATGNRIMLKEQE